MDASIKDSLQLDKEEQTHDILDLVSDPAADQSAVQSEFIRDLFNRDHSDEPIAQVPFALCPFPLPFVLMPLPKCLTLFTHPRELSNTWLYSSYHRNMWPWRLACCLCPHLGPRSASSLLHRRLHFQVPAAYLNYSRRHGRRHRCLGAKCSSPRRRRSLLRWSTARLQHT